MILCWDHVQGLLGAPDQVDHSLFVLELRQYEVQALVAHRIKLVSTDSLANAQVRSLSHVEVLVGGGSTLDYRCPLPLSTRFM